MFKRPTNCGGVRNYFSIAISNETYQNVIALRVPNSIWPSFACEFPQSEHFLVSQSFLKSTTTTHDNPRQQIHRISFLLRRNHGSGTVSTHLCSFEQCPEYISRTDMSLSVERSIKSALAHHRTGFWTNCLAPMLLVLLLVLTSSATACLSSSLFEIV
jgi:hypothetical protein